ncbi:anti-sigma U factor RsuA [Streptomyces phaeofaciens JCM 4814]|uniref:RNA polymerase subunit sigma n=1 Tax=Streptomyces phaeofaciens TaxID=68254 RepID=A0A918H7S8_9ACTN|nr:RNA polymerase subunit sigma [Streptomyces phaeofaciens]
MGAYALGILDDAEATAFEAHLAGCEWCAQQLDELAGMEPMLAALADLPGTGTPAIGESLSARPSPRLVDKLVDEVSERRAQKRRRSFFLVAAAAALIVGGPLTVLAATGGDSGSTGVQAGSTKSATVTTKSAFDALPNKVSATDASTKVSATVAMGEKGWGTEVGVELKNVTGPEKCSLIAVGKDGKRETVSSWAVPEWGYGIPNAKTEQAKNPLYVMGGAAFETNEIDHFEVMTFDGKKLVEVGV